MRRATMGKRSSGPIPAPPGAGWLARFRPNRLRLLLQTPAGRLQLVDELNRAVWPVVSWLPWLYRRTVVRRTRFVAVVGSFGKTTTTRATTVALGLTPHRRLPCNTYCLLGDAVLRARPWQRRAVVEVGINGPGQMSRYAAVVRPDVAVVTAIGSEHHSSLGSLEVTRWEKAFMLRALPASGLAVLNGDDPHVRWMASQTRARVVWFGFGERCTVRASDYAIDWPHGSRFMLHTASEQRAVRTRLLGRHQVYPLLAAVAVGLAEGLALDTLLARLEALPPTPGRMELVTLPNGAHLLRDDFKNALETCDAALDVLGAIPAARRLVVLGEIAEPPPSAGQMYRRLGARVAQNAARAVFVGHRKTLQRYRSGARAAGMPDTAMTSVGQDVLAATEAIRDELRPGDVVLVKGRAEQRLDRVGLALAGRTVRCTISSCGLHLRVCESCEMLERGWDRPPT